jgi:hypothetical protein
LAVYPVSAIPNTTSLAVVVVAGEVQLVTPLVWLFTVPQTSRTVPLVGIPEYSATIARVGTVVVIFTVVIPLGAFSR